MNLRPLRDQIIVLVDDEPKEIQTESGLFVATKSTAKAAPSRGKVMAVGPGKENKMGEYVPMDINVGDIVLFTRGGGIALKDRRYDDSPGDYRVMRHEDVFAVLEK